MSCDTSVEMGFAPHKVVSVAKNTHTRGSGEAGEAGGAGTGPGAAPLTGIFFEGLTKC